MKKIMIVSALVIVVLAALGFAGYAYAQSQQPGTYPGGYGGQGGMMGGRGGMMGGRGSTGAAYGPVHEYMVTAIAEALDMTPEALQARLDAGDTCLTVAEEKGLTQDEFYTLMKGARTSALTQAVADGVITQAQADWMIERMGQMQDYGAGAGSCPGGGMHGRGRWNSQPTGPQG